MFHHLANGRLRLHHLFYFQCECQVHLHEWSIWRSLQPHQIPLESWASSWIHLSLLSEYSLLSLLVFLQYNRRPSPVKVIWACVQILNSQTLKQVRLRVQLLFVTSFCSCSRHRSFSQSQFSSFRVPTESCANGECVWTISLSADMHVFHRASVVMTRQIRECYWPGKTDFSVSWDDT